MSEQRVAPIDRLRGEVDWWSRSNDLAGAIRRHALAVAKAEAIVLEFDCQQALDLTPVVRWPHLQILYVDPGFDETTVDWNRSRNEVILTTKRVPPAVACSWPAPVPREVDEPW